MWGYFLTFVFCWAKILSTLSTLIAAYLNYLADLTLRLTVWPNNLLFVVGAGVALAGAALILHVILHGGRGARASRGVPVAGVPVARVSALFGARSSDGGSFKTTTRKSTESIV